MAVEAEAGACSGRKVARRRSLLVASAVLLLTTAACGARWTDEQAVAIAARHATGSAAARQPTAAAGPGAPTSAPAGAGAVGVSGSGPSAGPAAAAADAPGGAATASALPCAAPSEAPGVTDGEIVVGSISSLSGPVPGLGASAAGAIRAYVARRNAEGGVCGRQIVLREADDGTDNGRYRSVVGDLGPQVFGVVGGFALGDVGGVDIVEGQALPIVSLPSGEAPSALPTVFDVNPGFDDPNAVIGKYRYLREQGASRVALVYLAVDQSRFEANLQRRLMEAAGIGVALQQELPLSTLSYDSAARAVANSGADYLFFIGDVTAEAAMATAMADTGHELRFAEYFNFAYGTPFLELAGSAAEGTVAWLRSLPNEEAAGNPEMAAFVGWMDQAAPGDALDAFAVDSWVAGKAFFDALEALPGSITREGLVAQLQATESFDAGGMYGSIRLGAERTNGCVVGMQVQNGEWRRLAPASGFLC